MISSDLTTISRPRRWHPPWRRRWTSRCWSRAPAPRARRTWPGAAPGGGGRGRKWWVLKRKKGGFVWKTIGKPWENGGLPSGNDCYISKMAIEIVDLSVANDDVP